MQPELVDALLFVAVAGLFLLFARDWSVRVAGGVLLLPRLLAAPLSQGEAVIFGSVTAAAVSLLIYRKSYGAEEARAGAPAAPEPAEPDDVSEPAPCVAG
jgi:hypothetical protein